jgi:hypothetical protein
MQTAHPGRFQFRHHFRGRPTQKCSRPTSVTVGKTQGPLSPESSRGRGIGRPTSVSTGLALLKSTRHTVESWRLLRRRHYFSKEALGNGAPSSKGAARFLGGKKLERNYVFIWCVYLAITTFHIKKRAKS